MPSPSVPTDQACKPLPAKGYCMLAEIHGLSSLALGMQVLSLQRVQAISLSLIRSHKSISILLLTSHDYNITSY